MQHEKAIQLAHTSSGPERVRDLTCKWRGQHGSVLELSTDGNVVTGTFTTFEGVFRHHVADVSGIVIGDLVSLSALWHISGAITSWSGEVVGQGEHARLKLMWRLIAQMSEPVEPKSYWLTSFGGAEDFTLQGENFDPYELGGEAGHAP